MTATISGGSADVVPDVVTVYGSSRPLKTTIHQILGSAAPAVTLEDAGNRTGSFEMVFVTEADALAAEEVLRVGVVFTLTDTVRTSINMSFVVAGDLPRVIETATYTWSITIQFQEV